MFFTTRVLLSRKFLGGVKIDFWYFFDFAADSEGRESWKMEKRGSASGSPAQEKVTHRECICGCVHNSCALTPALG